MSIKKNLGQLIISDKIWPLVSAQLVKTSPTFYDIRRCITMYRPPLASSRNHPNSVHALKTPFKFTSILSLNQFLGHKGGLFPSGFCDQSFVNPTSMLKGRLLRQHIRSYPPYMKAVSSRHNHAMATINTLHMNS